MINNLLGTSALALALLLSACVTPTYKNRGPTAVNDAGAASLAAVTRFDNCTDNAKRSERWGSETGALGHFERAGKTFATCVDGLGQYGAAVPRTTRMQIDARAALNLFKGLQPVEAKRQLDNFHRKYPTDTLYSPDDGMDLIAALELVIDLSLGTSNPAKVAGQPVPQPLRELVVGLAQASR